MRKPSEHLRTIQSQALPAIWKDKPFDVLKLRYDDQVSLLRKLTDIDLQVFGGYLTASLAFGSWLSQQPTQPPLTTAGLLLISAVLAFSATVLLYFNFKRRTEIIETVRTINAALGLDEIGAFVPDKAINAKSTFRPWRNVYFLCIWSVFLGLFLLLLSKQVQPVAPLVKQYCVASLLALASV